MRVSEARKRRRRQRGAKMNFHNDNGKGLGLRMKEGQNHSRRSSHICILGESTKTERTL
jgi:hypothetical protein